jgi:tetratricopeptide (TPR) repeat protein
VRRYLWILLVLAVAALLAAGVVWYVHNNSATKLLARAELALQAGEFDRALALTRSAIAKDPANWRGHYVQATAYSRLGRYDEARKSLAEAARHEPPGVTVELAMGETYANAGRRTLASPESGQKPSVLKDSVAQLRQANEYLAKVQAKDEAGRLDLQQAIALNLVTIGLADMALSRRLEKEAQTALEVGDIAALDASRKASAGATAEADKALTEASRMLLDVVKGDPSRDVAARTLVEVALNRKDQQVLAAARQVILAQEDPPPQAATMLIMHELAMAELQSRAQESTQLAAAAQRLDAILAKHPADLDVRLARAEVAVRSSDWTKAGSLCKEVLDAKPGQDQQMRARFIHANVLAAQDKRAEAEQVLAELKTQVPHSAQVQYAYALAAAATGKKELAREAMRTVTALDPSHAGARRFLAESLLAQGLASAAFPDALAYFGAHPDDPNALRLFVRAAKANNQEASAKQAILKVLAPCDPELHNLLAGLPRGTSLDAARITELKTSPAHADLMLAAAEGYDELGDRDKASAVRRRAAECRPTTVEEHLAVAEALRVIGRGPEAEKRLADERARDPGDARFALGLARLYEATGRNLQAIEEYRAAVRLDPRGTRSRAGLARALFDAGLLDECTSECQALLSRDPTHTAALQLVNQIRLMRGESNLDETPPVAGPGAPKGLPLAQMYLGAGQPQKCVEICLAELKKAPNSTEALSLLAFAYSALGQNDKSAEQWKAVLKDNPAQFLPYMQVADLLGKTMKPEEIDAALAAVPGAKRDRIDLALGWLLDRAGRYNEAAEAYRRVLTHQDIAADIRARARALSAQALSRAGRIDQSIVELDRLAEDPVWRTSALFAKAALLDTIDRAKEADQVLANLHQQAVRGKDDVLLGRMVPLYMQMKRTDKALAACDGLEQLLPNDPRPYLARASVLAAIGKLGEASDYYRKAVEKQPGDYRTHLALARTLDAVGKPGPAVDALRQLDTQGQAARSVALMELGDMLARWGLAAQAAEHYEQLAKLGYQGNPRLAFALAQAFARLGKKDRARELLGQIPVNAPPYVPANQLLADLEDTDDGKLRILRQIQKTKPGQPAVLVQEMSILVRANRPADVAKALQAFMADKAAAGAMPAQAYFLALQAMLLNHDSKAAAGMAIQIARETRSPSWRQLAALLTIDIDPGAAKNLIPGASEAGPYDALLGLILASRTGQDLAPWKSRLDEIQKNLSEMKPPQSIPPKGRFLAALAAGTRAEAEAEVARWVKAPGIDRQAAAELLAAAQNPKASAEVVELLKASLAVDLGLPMITTEASMKLLKARPTCQWAAVLAAQCDPDGSLAKEILRTLQPADCLLAQTIRARLALQEKQYEKAVEIRRAVANAEKENPESMMNLGTALEQAGHLEEALAVYRKVWETSQRPAAANNAAYLVSLLSPRDPAKLAEAARWMAEAVKAAPADAAFRDTLGWIAHLQGRDGEALLELHRAVKGMPDSPEAHYHLGEVEAVAGHTELARWHLAAAANIGDRFALENRNLPPASQKAVRLAREGLVKLAQPKP